MLKQKTIFFNRKKLAPLGAHTAVGHLHELKKWKNIPYLKENDGMLPPFIICVGSRVRVMKAKDILKLRDAVFIDEFARKKFGHEVYGRVSILIGMAESKSIVFPLAVVETQMGCPATQINMREFLYFTRQDGYDFSKKTFDVGEIYFARAGTCAGVNNDDPEGNHVKIGDIAISLRNIGSIGAVVQSYLGLLDFMNINIVRKKSNLLYRYDYFNEELFCKNKKLMVTGDKRHIITFPSEKFYNLLLKSVKESNFVCVAGSNFTKDSLYAEMSEKDFVELNKRYFVVSTEMEQVILDLLAMQFTKAGIKTNSGLVSAVIGTIPGKSFPETKKEKEAAKKAEENALFIIKETFGEIAKDPKKVQKKLDFRNIPA